MRLSQLVGDFAFHIMNIIGRDQRAAYANCSFSPLLRWPLQFMLSPGERQSAPDRGSPSAESRVFAGVKGSRKKPKITWFRCCRPVGARVNPLSRQAGYACRGVPPP